MINKGSILLTGFEVSILGNWSLLAEYVLSVLELAAISFV